MHQNQAALAQAAATLKSKPAELCDKAEAVMADVKKLQQTIEKYKAREAAGETDRLLGGAKELGGLKVLTTTVDTTDANALRQMGDMLRDKNANIVAVLSAVNGEKITFLAVCGKEAVTKGVKAGDIIKTITPICGGKGGGKPDSAMGGGSDVTKLNDALAAVDTFVASKLGL
jgi:alanyl-tRNA synthetase